MQAGAERVAPGAAPAKCGEWHVGDEIRGHAVCVREPKGGAVLPSVHRTTPPARRSRLALRRR
eukprot:11612356-Alexandrium_andersonii.AAC.1